MKIIWYQVLMLSTVTGSDHAGSYTCGHKPTTYTVWMDGKLEFDWDSDTNVQKVQSRVQGTANVPKVVVWVQETRPDVQ